MGGKTSNVGPGRVTLHSVVQALDVKEKNSFDQVSHHPIEAPSGEMTDLVEAKNKYKK